MALIHADGFDHYGTNTAFASDLYTFVNGGQFIAAAPGMTGTGSYRGSNCHIIHNFSLRPTPIIVGCRLSLSNLANGTFVAITTGSYTGPGFYCYFGTAGEVIVGNFRLGVTYGTSATGVYAPSSAFYLEMRLAPSTTGTGTIQVRVNNQVVINISGLTTAAQYAAFVNGAENNAAWDMDDLYVCDNSGPQNNTFLGDRQMITTYGTSDEVGNTWSLVGGATGFGIIDNNPPVDAQYIQGATAGDVSAFTHGQVATTAVSIAAAVMFARCSKSDAGVATMGVGLESNGFTDYDTAIAPSVGFGLYKRILELDPDGDIPWTYPKFNASKLRVERLT